MGDVSNCEMWWIDVQCTVEMKDSLSHWFRASVSLAGFNDVFYDGFGLMGDGIVFCSIEFMWVWVMCSFGKLFYSSDTRLVIGFFGRFLCRNNVRFRHKDLDWCGWSTSFFLTCCSSVLCGPIKSKTQSSLNFAEKMMSISLKKQVTKTPRNRAFVWPHSNFLRPHRIVSFRLICRLIRHTQNRSWVNSWQREGSMKIMRTTKNDHIYADSWEYVFPFWVWSWTRENSKLHFSSVAQHYVFFGFSGAPLQTPSCLKLTHPYV